MGEPQALTAAPRWERWASGAIVICVYAGVSAIVYYAALGAFGWRPGGFFFGWVTALALTEAREEIRERS